MKTNNKKIELNVTDAVDKLLQHKIIRTIKIAVGVYLFITTLSASFKLLADVVKNYNLLKNQWNR